MPNHFAEAGGGPITVGVRAKTVRQMQIKFFENTAVATPVGSVDLRPGDWSTDPGLKVGVKQWRAAEKLVKPDQMQASILWKTLEGDGRAVPGGLICVYRSRVEVHTVATDGSPRAAVPVQLSGAVNEEWKTYAAYAGSSDFSREVISDQNGLAVFDRLPLLDGYSFKVAGSFTGTEWVTADGFSTAGARRKVKVVQKAALLWPAHAAVQHQLVNLKPAEAAHNAEAADVKQGWGSTIAIRAKLLGGGQGRIYLHVSADSGNSKRTADPAPSLDGKPLRPGGSAVASAETDAAGEATFRLQLGVAGGDKFHCSVAGHPGVSGGDCDAFTTVDTWRRLYLKAGKPEGLGFDMLPPPDEAKAEIEKALKDANIEIAWEPGFDSLSTYGSAAPHLRWLEQADAARFMMKERSLVYTSTTALDAQFNSGGINTAHGLYPPRRWLVLAHLAVKRSAEDTFVRSISSYAPLTLRVTKTGYFAPRDAKGASMIQPWAEGEASHCLLSDGSKIPITPEFLTPKADKQCQEADFVIPQNLRPAADKFPIKVNLKVMLANGLAGGSMGRVVAGFIGGSAKKFVYIALHEVAHSFGLVPANPTAKGWGEIEGENTWYEHDGGHCSTGIAAGDKPWKLAIPDKAGDCVMFSPLNSHTVFDRGWSWFCPRCILMLKAAEVA